MGCHLTTLFNNTFENAAIPASAPEANSAAPKKRGWLPLLTVLFCLSYALMTMLIVEQGQTIDSQRALIRELFRDSTELSAVKAQALRNSAQAHAQASGAASARTPSNQIPSTPSTQAPTQQAPSSQVVPQHQVQKENQKPQFRMPSRPASDLNDENRALITI